MSDRGELAAPLGLSVEQAAWTVHQVVNENMANAARVHAVEHGRDARAFPLFAFGGAGPVHAFRVAEKLAVRELIAPFGAGVGSTIGMLAAPLAFDFVRTAAARVDALDWDLVPGLLREMEAEGRALLARAGVPETEIQVERAADMRLIGQAHEITVELPGPPPGPGDEPRISAAFESTYARLYGRTPPEVPLEVVSWRVRLAGPNPELRLGDGEPALSPPSDAGQEAGAATSDAGLKGHRPAYFPEQGGFSETPVYDRYQLGPGAAFAGPAIVEERESTVILGPRARARVDRFRNLVVELGG